MLLLHNGAVTQRQLVSSIAGTTAAVEAGGAVGGDGIGEQARQAWRRIASGSGQAGAGLEHVVRTCRLVTDISLGRGRPRSRRGLVWLRLASSTLEISSLMDPHR
jgi:enamine deaminase RidA (YjgF/YER057c/UK114 family)